MSERIQILRADQEVARILAESDSEHALYARVLAAVGESLAWELGAMWELLPGADVLGCLEVWCAPVAWPGAPEFAEATRKALLGPARACPGGCGRAASPPGSSSSRRTTTSRARSAPRSRESARRRLLPDPEPERHPRGDRVLHLGAARSGPRDARDDGQPGQPDRAAGGAAARGGPGPRGERAPARDCWRRRSTASSRSTTRAACSSSTPPPSRPSATGPTRRSAATWPS